MFHSTLNIQKGFIKMRKKEYKKETENEGRKNEK
jgi:hypothetical protein